MTLIDHSLSLVTVSRVCLYCYLCDFVNCSFSFFISSFSFQSFVDLFSCACCHLLVAPEYPGTSSFIFLLVFKSWHFVLAACWFSWRPHKLSQPPNSTTMFFDLSLLFLKFFGYCVFILHISLSFLFLGTLCGHTPRVLAFCFKFRI